MLKSIFNSKYAIFAVSTDTRNNYVVDNGVNLNILKGQERAFLCEKSQ